MYDIYRLGLTSDAQEIAVNWSYSQNDWTRHILGHFGDGGVTAASARIIAAASAEASSPAQPHSVCGVE